jgi:hypothetical protein
MSSEQINKNDENGKYLVFQTQISNILYLWVLFPFCSSRKNVLKRKRMIFSRRKMKAHIIYVKITKARGDGTCL